MDEALPWCQRAYDLAPTVSVPATILGPVYEILGDSRRAEALLRRAVELQPNLGQAHSRLIFFYVRQRRDRQALEQAHTGLRLAPSDQWVIAAAEAELIAGDMARARLLFEQALPFLKGVRLSRHSDAGVETFLAYLDLRSGRRSEAEVSLSESLEADRRQIEEGNQDWTVPFDEACVYALRGGKDRRRMTRVFLGRRESDCSPGSVKSDFPRPVPD